MCFPGLHVAGSTSRNSLGEKTGWGQGHSQVRRSDREWSSVDVRTGTWWVDGEDGIGVTVAERTLKASCYVFSTERLSSPHSGPDIPSF